MADPQIDFYLNSKSQVLQYDTLELSHPQFTQTYRIVRNNRVGAMLGVAGVLQQFVYCPFRMERSTVEASLSQSIKITLADLGSIVQTELISVMRNEGYLIRPTVIVRCYRSDVPMEPIYGPVSLIASDITMTREGSAFTIQPPEVSNKRTGMIYTLEDYPGLRGFL